jgi:hypothetical protein
LGRRKRGWNEAAALSLHDLRRLVDEKMGQVERLSAKRAEIAAALEEVEAELATAGANGTVAPRRRGRGRPAKRGRRGPGRPPKSRRRPGRPAPRISRPRISRKQGKRGRPPKAKGSSPLHDMIRDVLKASSEPMKLAEIAEKVKAAGYETKSPNFAMILGLRLSEMKDVRRVERGVYAMK